MKKEEEMKTINILKGAIVLAVLTFYSCDPNKELYQQLDDLQQPYNKAVQYTLTVADYNSVGGSVKTYQAFNDTAPAKNYVPSMLTKKYLALNLKSSAQITYNYLLIDTVRAWEKVVFGYTLTAADYTAIGGSVGIYQNFWAANPASNHLPNYLLTLYPNATAGQSQTIIYNFYYAANQILPYADIYEFDGTVWIFMQTITDMAEADYILSLADYQSMGYTLARFPDIAAANRNLPIFFKLKFPYAYEGDDIIVQFAYGTTSATNVASQYVVKNNMWVKSTGFDVEERKEQYVYGINGWVFDPTIRFIMAKSDYATVAYSDPIPHPRFADQGYYYGASGFYGNFDMRLLAFHLRVYTYNDVTYDPEVDDPELYEIFNTQGADAATAELFRRIVQEGLIALLKNKFPEAVPESGGIEVHYVVGFETYNDNLSRSYLEAEYKCTAAASGDTPPQFEFVDGPRARQ
jgi:hypothetical protein